MIIKSTFMLMFKISPSYQNFEISVEPCTEIDTDENGHQNFIGDPWTCTYHYTTVKNDLI